MDKKRFVKLMRSQGKWSREQIERVADYASPECSYQWLYGNSYLLLYLASGVPMPLFEVRAIANKIETMSKDFAFHFRKQYNSEDIAAIIECIPNIETSGTIIDEAHLLEARNG